jgi:hypothetical protein
MIMRRRIRVVERSIAELFRLQKESKGWRKWGYIATAIEVLDEKLLILKMWSKKKQRTSSGKDS